MSHRIRATEIKRPTRDDRVSDDGRNGLITAIGIVLAFSLTFFGQWSLGDDPWEARDLGPVSFMCIGNSLLLISLYRALVPYTQTVKRYTVTAQLFLVGILVMMLGFIWSFFA